MRPAFFALWNLDLAFADVIATSSDPRLGAIRLAWWRERLEELDDRTDPPAEPRLQAAARELLQRGVTGNELSNLEDAWLPLLEPFPWGGRQAEGLKQRGRILFGVGARVLGGDGRDAEACGEFWSLLDGSRHCSDRASRDTLLASARAIHSRVNVARAIRPLTVLAAIARADLNGSNGFARGRAALRHRLTGRISLG